jgi:hypothetical protein
MIILSFICFMLCPCFVHALSVDSLENILVSGPPAEMDWWEEESSSSSSDEEEEIDLDEVSEQYEEEEVQVPATGSSKSESSSVNPASSAESTRSRRRRFRNVGLETWEKANEAWKAGSLNTSSISSSSGGSSSASPIAATIPSAPTPSNATRRELMKGLSGSRQYEMKHRVALDTLVAIYNEMWTEEWSD